MTGRRRNKQIVYFLAATLCVATASHAQEGGKRYDFRVEGRTLGEALDEVYQQTEIQQLYSHDLVDVTGVHPVNGQYTVDEALQLMLQGTRFSGGLTENGVIVITFRDDTQLRVQENQMFNKKNLLAGASAALLAAAAGLPAYAQNADDTKVEKTVDKKAKAKKKDKKKDQIIITGSRIARSNYNLSSPVKVIQAVEFERVGATSVFELLSLLPEVGANGIIDAAPFASDTINGSSDQGNPALGGKTALGANSISLRSFGPTSTLILVNGRRIASHGFVSGSTGGDVRSTPAAVITNLDNIPVEAIERIEILKGGASTIYGTDAIAGVINIILKKGYNDMRSLTANVRMTTKGDNAQYRLAYSQGFSGIGGGDNSLLLSGEYVHQNSLPLLARTLNDSDSQAGSDDGSGNRFGGSRANFLNVTHRSPGGTLVLREGGWNFVPGTGWVYTDPSFAYRPYEDINPNAICADKLVVTGDTLSGTPQTGTKCVIDNSSKIDLTPKFDRFGLSSTFDHSFQNGIDIYASGMFSYRSQFNRMTPEAVGIAQRPGARRDPYTFGLPGEVLVVELTDVGDRSRLVKGVNLSSTIGLKGRWNDQINWNVSANYSHNTNTVTYKNYVLRDKFYDARIAFFDADPTNDDQAYLFGQPGQTPKAVVDRIRAPDFQRTGKTSTLVLDGHISGELFEGPAGAISYAFGGTFTRDSLADQPSPLAITNPGGGGQSKVFSGPQGTPYDSTRSRTAVFGELLVPVIKDHLELEFAAREDFDDQFGSHFSPKVGFRLDAIPDAVMFRGSYTAGFRAPSITEVGYPEGTVAWQQVLLPEDSPLWDPSLCFKPSWSDIGFCSGANLLTRTQTNSNIQPETSKQYNLGVVINPFENLEFAVDWYKITRSNEIRFFPGNNSYVTHPDTILSDPITGFITEVVSFYGNVGATENQGVDFSARYFVDLGRYGELTNSMSVIRNISNVETRGNIRNFVFDGTTGLQHVLGFSGRPKWRATNTLSWLIGDWRTTMTYRYRGSYHGGRARSQEELNTTRPCDATRFKYNCMVPAHDTVDLNIAFTGIKNVTLTLNSRNLFDEIAETNINVNGSQNFRRIGQEVSFRANYRF